MCHPKEPPLASKPLVVPLHIFVVVVVVVVVVVLSITTPQVERKQ